MAMRLVAAAAVVFVMVAGCASTTWSGPCDEGQFLLVVASGSNMPESGPSHWFVVFEDGEAWQMAVDSEYEQAPAGESDLEVKGPWLPRKVCGVLARHHAYPTPDEADEPYERGTWQAGHWHVEARAVGRLDPATVHAFAAEHLDDLPADSSIPNCDDGGNIGIHYIENGTSRRYGASCNWTAEFEEVRRAARELEAGIRWAQP